MYVGKGSINLYDKRDLKWFYADYDHVSLELKAGIYYVSFISSASTGSFAVEFYSGNSKIASKVLNNIDFNDRNYFEIELTSDITMFRIWNDVACTISNIMIVPKIFGKLGYKESIPTNEKIYSKVNSNMEYMNEEVVSKLEKDFGKYEDITDNYLDSGAYGYTCQGIFNKAILYPTGGGANAHCTYNVSYNEKYKVELYTTTNAVVMHPVIFVDDNMIVVDIIRHNVSSEKKIFEFRIPFGATKMLISLVAGNDYPCSVKKMEYNNIEKVIDNSIIGVKEYYKEHLANKIEIINGYEQGIGINGDTIAFITDIHVPSNSMNSPYLLKEIYNKTNLSMIFDGGDIAFGSSSVINTKSLCISELYKGINTFNSILDNRIVRCVGNHDNNGYGAYYQGQEYISPNELFGILFKRQHDKVAYDENNHYGNYCYYDNEKQKIRYIMLSTEESGDKKGFSVSQTEWLINKAFVFPSSGWSVAIFTHQPIKDNGNYYHHREMFKALNLGTTFSYTDTSGSATYNINADFRGDKQADVLFVACGHEHKDAIAIDNTVVYFQTTCDAHYNDDEEALGYKRTVGTIYEQAFDVICINKTTKHIDLVRVGAGSNRGFYYGSEPIID